MQITKEFLKQRPLSFTSFSHFLTSPRHYINYLTTPKEETKDTQIGRIVGEIIETGENRYIRGPEGDKRSKAVKDAWIEVLSGNEPELILAPDTYDQIMAMVDSAMSHQFIKNFMWSDTEHKFEVEIGGIPLVGYIDIYTTSAKVEIKTVQSANYREVQRDFYDRRYPVQSALYDIAMPTEENYYICIEKKPPYITEVYPVARPYINYGKRVLDRGIEEFKRCMEQDAFGRGYSYFTGDVLMEPLDVPMWAK